MNKDLQKRIIVNSLVVFGIIILTAGVLYFRYNSNKVAPLKNIQENSSDIELLKKNITDNPDQIKNYITLSQLYLQKVRETADIHYYTSITDLMNTAEKISPNNPDIFSLRASVEIGRHNFAVGKKNIEKAIELNANDHTYYGLLGDANIELGLYDEAVNAFQKMTDLRPGYSSYVRIAYIRELNGDIKGAIEALDQAITSGSKFNENIAFAYVEQGKLHLGTDLAEAELDFKRALSIVPDYPPALEGLGKLAYFKGDTVEAQEYLIKAYDKLPIAQYATDIADLYTLTGKTAEAKQYLALAQITYEKSVSSGINTDLEESLFLSDHDLDLKGALEKAQRAYRERKSIYTADYLSWALYKNGEVEKAKQYTDVALRLGEHDPLILFHQGMIALANKDNVNARKFLSKALKINSYFSLIHAKAAKETLNNIK